MLLFHSPLFDAYVQYLNIKLNDVQVVDEQKFPHLVRSLRTSVLQRLSISCNSLLLKRSACTQISKTDYYLFVHC
jgi:hypothetical protein